MPLLNASALEHQLDLCMEACNHDAVILFFSYAIELCMDRTDCDGWLRLEKDRKTEILVHNLNCKFWSFALKLDMQHAHPQSCPAHSF